MGKKKAIRDRIKDFRRVKASELFANPRNWRRGQANTDVIECEQPGGMMHRSAVLTITRLRRNRAMSIDKSTVAYRTVQGFPAYRVGDDGSIWSCWERLDPNHGGKCVGARYRMGTTWRPLRKRLNRTGYIRAVLFPGRTTRAVHLLVLEAFIGPRPHGMVACHANDVKDDNRLENLRWDTMQANWADRIRNGKVNPPIGENHRMAKLSECDVRGIRSLDSRGVPSPALAKMFCVTHGNVRLIVNRRTWKHV